MKINDEFVDGFHIESLPYFTYAPFNWDAVSKVSGIRAVWYLYKKGLWDALGDLGIDKRAKILLDKYPYNEQLTDNQAYSLYKKVPILAEASRQLRLAYFLKYYDTDPQARKEIRKKINMDEQIFIAEVTGTDRQTEIIVNRHQAEIEAAGGTISMLRGYGHTPPHIKVTLPGISPVEPENLLKGETKVGHFSRQRGSLTMPKEETNADTRKI